MPIGILLVKTSMLNSLDGLVMFPAHLSLRGLFEDTITFKKNFKLPVVRLKLKRNGRVVFKNAKVKFLRILYPIGRCFLILYPVHSAHKLLILHHNRCSAKFYF